MTRLLPMKVTQKHLNIWKYFFKTGFFSIVIVNHGRFGTNIWIPFLKKILFKVISSMTLLTLFIIYFARNSLTLLSQSTPVSSPVKNRPIKPLPADTKMNTCFRRLIGFFITPEKTWKIH